MLNKNEQNAIIGESLKAALQDFKKEKKQEKWVWLWAIRRGELKYERGILQWI